MHFCVLAHLILTTVYDAVSSRPRFIDEEVELVGIVVLIVA